MKNQPHRQHLSRRHFVRTFSLGTASSVLFGRAWQAAVLADITPSNVGLLRVKLSDYPALLEDYGSVRLGLNPIENPSGPLGNFYPILINHHIDAAYYAMSTMCHHAGCIVPPFNEGDGGIVCPCHGSGYWIDGSLLNGPSGQALDPYAITFDGADTLTVEVPGLGYCVNSALVQSAGAPRLRLSFPTFENVEYEVRFRMHIRDEWSVVPFALALDGPEEEFSIIGGGAPVTVFVNRTTPTGFYTIAIKVIDFTNG